MDWPLITPTGLNRRKPHFVLVPLMAQGHTIPAVDLALLLAGRGAVVSFITTPVNAARIRPAIDRARSDCLPVRFVELPFPCSEVGLPDGCENIDLILSKDLFRPFFRALCLLREPLELYLRHVDPAPTCIVADYCNYFTASVARALGVPRVIFHGPSCFFILCMHNINTLNVYDGVGYQDTVVLPNLPVRIEVTRAQAPGWFHSPEFADVHDDAVAAEATADGVVVNSFYELEPEVIDRYKETVGKPVWPVGPLSLRNRDFTSQATRGRKSSVDERQVLTWLDSMPPESVVLVSFGSLVVTKPPQLVEIGSGLEASGRPFVWVIKEVERCPEVEKWMSEGFEERTKGRGLVITGWAPQVVILSHPSVGGFVTHCGWNSTLESVCAGVPMVTWPHFADQFLNEKLVVQVLKVGVSIGVKVPIYDVEEGEVPVRREEVERAIGSLMDGGDEGEGRRQRAADYGDKGRRAMEEGGSSHENLARLIDHFTPATV